MGVTLVLCARPHVPIRRVYGADELRRFRECCGSPTLARWKGGRSWAGIGVKQAVFSRGPSRVSASESSWCPVDLDPPSLHLTRTRSVSPRIFLFQVHGVRRDVGWPGPEGSHLTAGLISRRILAPAS